MNSGNAKGALEWSTLEDRYFKQARACAGDLGLTVTSRCKLVLPPKEAEEDDPFEALLAGRKHG